MRLGIDKILFLTFFFGTLVGNENNTTYGASSFARKDAFLIPLPSVNF